MYQHKNFNILW